MLLIMRMFWSAHGCGAAGRRILVGDFFPPEERAQIYGVILGSELVGIGFSLSGEISTALGWR